MCEDRLSDMVRKEVPARLADLILRLREFEGLITDDGSHMIPIRYTHQQMASMVGSNREAVTRAFGKLRKAGAVERQERFGSAADSETGLLFSKDVSEARAEFHLVLEAAYHR